ncbi:MAG: IS110 family transposase [Gammaproteobacteria bacterium]|nr:IS110 family transposase [Gammaproteobacteria bacterium]
MSLYCGIDLHSNNHVVVVIDEKDKRLYERRLSNELLSTLQALEPFRDELDSVIIESTFNWYWLVDGLMDHGYHVELANPTACKQQYSGLKYSDDKHDAFWLAHMKRLGILPTGYIYPPEQRAIRDMLRRRLQLVQLRSKQLISIQSQIWRSTGIRVSSNQIRKTGFNIPLPDGLVCQAAQSNLTIFKAIDAEVKYLEATVLSAINLRKGFKILKTIKGVGDILGMTIMLETGDIGRFASVGNYSSYCRCVRSIRVSNGKVKGKGNTKAGNRYLSWAFSEAAHFAVRWDPLAKRFYERKKRKTNQIIAIRAVAHKLARATYRMLTDQTSYNAKRAFG